MAGSCCLYVWKVVVSGRLLKSIARSFCRSYPTVSFEVDIVVTCYTLMRCPDGALLNDFENPLSHYRHSRGRLLSRNGHSLPNICAINRAVFPHHYTGRFRSV